MRALPVLGLFVVLLLIPVGIQNAFADIIYESATLGPTGASGGFSLSEVQFLGSRFSITETVEVSAIGGHMLLFGGDSLFGAIVNLSGPLPTGSPFTGSEVLASTVFSPGTPSSDVSVPLSVILPPGDYAIIFGTGLFGAAGFGAMPGTGNNVNTPEGSGSYFFWNGNNWQDGGFDNARFTVNSEVDLPPPEIGKTLVEGSDEIGIYLPQPTRYVYTIEYTGPAALVKDTVPAEFKVLDLETSDGTADDFKPGKGAKSQSSTKIEWLVPEGTSTLTVTIETVQSKSQGKVDGERVTVFKPTSCGTLPINDGATAFEVNADGTLRLVEVADPDNPGETILEPVVIVGPSNSLEVEAIDGAKPCIEIGEDPNGE